VNSRFLALGAFAFWRSFFIVLLRSRAQKCEKARAPSSENSCTPDTLCHIEQLLLLLKVGQS
jgi:hypothetical protein